jgi:hypothetical protein
MTQPIATSAQGVYLYDEGGKQYLDGSSGVLNVNLGHSHPEILQAITRQLSHLTFVHRSQFRSRPLSELTRELIEVGPEGTGHVEFSNSGSEANETALRIALAYHHRSGRQRSLLLSERPSYHGVTAGALALTGQPAKRDPSVAPLIANATTTPHVRARPGMLRADIEDWTAALDRTGRDRVAAVVIEPVGGSSSGAAPISTETLRWLRAEADRHDFLVIADEIMSGFGRTGRWWGCDHAGIAPDLLTSGKGLTGGYTSLAVTFVADRVIEAFGDTPLGGVVLGHTMSGNPLATATCLAILRHLREHDLPAVANTTGRVLRARLERLAGRHPVVTQVRGRGLMLGLGLAGDPDRPLAIGKRLIELARRHGLVLCPGGSDHTTESVMVAPPLNITVAEVDDLVARLEPALDDLADEDPRLWPSSGSSEETPGSRRPFSRILD